AMQQWGMRSDALQLDPQRPTGRVSVSFNAGEPAYDIVPQVAYDAIVAEAVKCDCRLLYHGSLALREATSRSTAELIKAGKPDTVFVDVNLRSPWWQKEQLLEMVADADWVKLNGDELALLAPSADGAAFVAEHELQGLVLTHGADGAEIMTADGERILIRPEKAVPVIDTVGAGDAFASIMILGLDLDWPIEQTAQRAQAFASALVGKRGATVSDPAFYRPFIDAWELGNL
ncbi:MAG: PfkB family carbohydrate kinase, partial [Pseudomonadota bacterium]